MSGAPIVVSYGGGTNSTAMLIELARRGERVDLILFADTGGERPGTYAYLRLFSDWLQERGYPEIETVAATQTLEDNCLEGERMPSIAYGFKSCSDRWKRRPIKRRVRELMPKTDITMPIGIDAEESHRAKESQEKWITHTYPLLTWNWGRDECVQAIEGAGLPQPGKSSCFFCPSMKPREILSLKKCHPDLLERALEIERRAAPHCHGTIAGLGRNWTWESLVQADKAQLKMFKNHTDTACGCYDG